MPKTLNPGPRSAKKNAYCIFTSAGDHSNVATWIPPDNEREWDLIVAFYGETEEAYQALSRCADVIIRCKGGKFQNLKTIAAQQPGLLRDYRRIWVADDDLIFTKGNPGKLFEIADQFGFELCQPAFNPIGRVSHHITAVSEKNHLARIVNFVEVTCPLFETGSLLSFLDVLDARLVSFGTDWWFSQYLDAGYNHRIAVIDAVVVLNPLESQRPDNTREINKLMSTDQRSAIWVGIREAYKLREFEHKILAEIFSTPAPTPGS